MLPTTRKCDLGPKIPRPQKESDEYVGYRPTAVSIGLKNAFYCYIENILTKVPLKDCLDNSFMGNVERWSQRPEFIDVFTKKVLISKTGTNLLATFVNRQMDGTFNKYRLDARKATRLPEEKPHPVQQPSTSD